MSTEESVGEKQTTCVQPSPSSLQSLPPEMSPPMVVAPGSASEDTNGAMASSSEHEMKESERFSSAAPMPQEEQRRRQQQKPQKQKRNKRHGARNQHRHKFFVKWLLETFDLEESRAKPPIAETSTDTCTETNNTSQLDSTGSKDENTNHRKAVTVDGEVPDHHNSTLVSDDENERCTHQSEASADSISGRPQRKMHILDVAGGKGEVSARLTMCHQQQVIMVDPRPADIVECYERIVLPKIPNKWQRRLEKQREANPNFVKDLIKARFQQLVTTFDEDKVITDSACNNIETTQSLPSPLNKVESNSKSLTDLQSAVQNSTLIVGLHADGATEAIVDAALKYNKPFVVVPCCVFPNFFPNRRILVDDPGDGNPPKIVSVRTHEQFCTYLLRKDPRFVMEELPFEGRNIAIWWDGK